MTPRLNAREGTFGSGERFSFSLECKLHLWYRTTDSLINCTFLPKSEIFYTADVKNLCSM